MKELVRGCDSLCRLVFTGARFAAGGRHSFVNAFGVRDARRQPVGYSHSSWEGPSQLDPANATWCASDWRHLRCRRERDLASSTPDVESRSSTSLVQFWPGYGSVFYRKCRIWSEPTFRLSRTRPRIRMEDRSRRILAASLGTKFLARRV